MSGHDCDREEWNQRRTGAEYLGGGQLSGISGVTGFELSRQFREHANKLGARVVQDEVVQVELQEM